ncbi:hypothetical protein IGI04_002487 [Brassica rapa subsp. trilocularis]|uniref:Aspartic peptidase DDI1-type domain-containing protein n=1 Tax=Brassica rapa subsp. trilocularis TaxID=1813537 RepID=A0ABQ7NVP6_BRACM|nr:hypothetical protein IGI04_002487 [Brassica rapa subsp. trilocularis]
MLDRVLLGQQQITMDFNGKIDSAYNNLNTKIETLGTQVRKLETQVIQTGETIKRQEAFAREAGADKGKHHVNAIIDDEFWQVVRNENLEEGYFEIESSMKFAAKHPHLPSPFYEKIDRSVNSTIDRQSESDFDRHNTPPIDRQAPLTYRVRLPLIDNDYINALRPPPKPLANPPEPTPNPLNSSTEPVQEEQESEGRRLRKRKEKIPKNLKGEANIKEMDGFTKRVLRIPIKKPFDEAYFTHRLWMFFRETKVTEEDIRRMFHQVIGKMKHRITLTKKSDPGKFAIPCIVKGVEFPHSMCDTGSSVSILPRIMADQLGLTIKPSTESFTFVDLSEKQSGGIIRDLEVLIGNALVPVDFHVLDIELNWNSSLLLGRSFLATVGAACDMNKNKLCLTLIDPNIHYDPIQPKRKVINSVDYGKELAFIGACHCGAEYESEYEITLPSIDVTVSTSIDTTLNPNLSISKKNNYANIDYGFLTPDEFGIFRDPDSNGRAMDGRILQVSSKDIADILQVTNGPDNLFSQQRGTPDVILTNPNNHA